MREVGDLRSCSWSSRTKWLLNRVATRLRQAKIHFEGKILWANRAAEKRRRKMGGSVEIDFVSWNV